MEMDTITIIGFIAGTCTTFSLIPQVIKSITSKETKDISLFMFIILAIGLLFWIIYGLLIGEIPIILANLFSFFLTLTIILLKIKHG
jgi:MtN3 and saliva related transmembrane protein